MDRQFLDIIDDRLAEIAQAASALRKLPPRAFVPSDRTVANIAAHSLTEIRDLLSDALAQARRRDVRTIPQQMADVMVLRAMEQGHCTEQALIDADFSLAEIIEYGDEARAIARLRLRGKPEYHADAGNQAA